ncbi:MAG: hypothetical protein IPL72_00725 [Sulfuritalea sp.]|nr:hypothetical protein [Sulfuritalea sp.]
MPLAAPDRKPDYELALDVKNGAKHVATVPCEIWLPAGSNDKPLVRFTSRDRGHSSLIQGPYELDGTIYSFDKKPSVMISAQGVWFQRVSSKFISGTEPPVITGVALPEKLIAITSLNSAASSEQATTYLHFEISENQLLDPIQIIETSYTGSRKVRTIRTQRIDVYGVGRLRFTRHYHEQKSQSQPRESIVRDRLVAETRLSLPAESLIAKDPEIRHLVEECLLIASFAARQRTIAPTWHAVDNMHLVKCFAGNISVPEQKPEPSIHDVLIDSREFSSFFKGTLKRYGSLPEQARALLRDALYRVLPSPNKTLESRYLSLFSALESTILWFRRNADFEYTIPESRSWKAFSRDVRSLIDSHSAIRDDLRRNMIIDTVGGLRRVPLRHAFFAYCKRFGVQLDDLWPVFGHAASLNNIRNKLSHGDTYDRAAFEALMYAEDNHQVLVERMLLAAFRWPVTRSNVSQAHLKAYGWVADVDLEKHMRMLKNYSGDLDKPSSESSD